MSLPSAPTVVKAVAMTALAVVILNLVKPYLPQQARDLLTL